MLTYKRARHVAAASTVLEMLLRVLALAGALPTVNAHGSLFAHVSGISSSISSSTTLYCKTRSFVLKHMIAFRLAIKHDCPPSVGSHGRDLRAECMSVRILRKLPLPHFLIALVRESYSRYHRPCICGLSQYLYSCAST